MPGNPPPHKKSQVLFYIQETAMIKETKLQTNKNINNNKKPNDSPLPQKLRC